MICHVWSVNSLSFLLSYDYHTILDFLFSASYWLIIAHLLPIQNTWVKTQLLAILHKTRPWARTPFTGVIWDMDIVILCPAALISMASHSIVYHIYIPVFSGIVATVNFSLLRRRHIKVLARERQHNTLTECRWCWRWFLVTGLFNVHVRWMWDMHGWR